MKVALFGVACLVGGVVFSTDVKSVMVDTQAKVGHWFSETAQKQKDMWSKQANEAESRAKHMKQAAKGQR